MMAFRRREGEFFDVLETRDAEAREEALMAALAAHVAQARRQAPYYARVLQHVDPDQVTSRAALAALPLTRKSDLVMLQAARPAFGDLTAIPRAGRRASSSAPGRSTTPSRRGATSSASAARSSPPGCAPGRSCTTPSPATSRLPER